MRASLLVVSIGLILLAAIGFALRPHARSASAVTSISFSPNAKPDFETDIKPIFQARCQPCHFQGGQVYDKLPFDKPATITKLGTRLFTRIKDEKERRMIQEFLDASNSDARNR
ncbi:MAG TPA: hypothetical protein VGJ69_05805 [Pyrinomonadaceae bacterium]|jgi:hypothetical protein